jgi:hypothetical protein
MRLLSTMISFPARFPWQITLAFPSEVVQIFIEIFHTFPICHRISKRCLIQQINPAEFRMCPEAQISRVEFPPCGPGRDSIPISTTRIPVTVLVASWKSGSTIVTCYLLRQSLVLACFCPLTCPYRLCLGLQVRGHDGHQ